ncbi:unnamed protein product [Orchesella dallaii]|uniref:Uncharacterized protein n=1 Tax=Orchesella dallaii TaxID=48710 RepID=A0ABP1PVL3_9HEXA
MGKLDECVGLERGPASWRSHGFSLSVLVLLQILAVQGKPWVPTYPQYVPATGQGPPPVATGNAPQYALGHPSPPLASYTPAAPPQYPPPTQYHPPAPAYHPPPPSYQGLNTHSPYNNPPYSHPPTQHVYYSPPAAHYPPPQPMQSYQVYQNQHHAPPQMLTYPVNQMPNYPHQYSQYAPPPPPPPQHSGSWPVHQAPTQYHPSQAPGYGPPPPVPAYGVYHPQPTPAQGGPPAGHYYGHPMPQYYAMPPQGPFPNTQPIQPQPQTAIPAPPTSEGANRVQTELANPVSNQEEKLSSTNITTDINLPKTTPKGNGSGYELEQNAPPSPTFETPLKTETVDDQAQVEPPPIPTSASGSGKDGCKTSTERNDAKNVGDDNGSSLVQPVFDSVAMQEDIDELMSLDLDVDSNLVVPEAKPENLEVAALIEMENTLEDMPTTTEESGEIVYIDS